jgi:hypothetical protein
MLVRFVRDGNCMIQGSIILGRIQRKGSASEARQALTWNHGESQIKKSKIQGITPILCKPYWHHPVTARAHPDSGWS